MQIFEAEGDLPDEVIQGAVAEGIVAIDTETSGLDPRLGGLSLVQVLVPGMGVTLVRHLDEEARGLSRLLGDEGVEKVFHFAPFDLRFLYATTGMAAVNVTCTKAASKLLAPKLGRSAHSLGPLVQRYFGEQLDKGSVRTSDWNSTSLSERQRAYAVRDVEFLIELSRLQIAELKQKGLGEVYRRVCDYMPTAARLDMDGYPNPLEYN